MSASRTITMKSIPRNLLGCALAIAGCLTVSDTRAQVQKTDKPIGVKPAQVGPPAPPRQAPKVQRPKRGPAPNTWFKETRLDLGTFIEGETAVGTFRFTNPHEETHRLSNIAPNCQCAKAKLVVGDRSYVIENDPTPHTIYRVEGEDEKTDRVKVKHIAVAPGEEGYVEIHLSLKGIKGSKEAHIAMRTTDKKLPMTTVSATARGVTFFRVVPPDINLNKMTWDEKRDFSFEISSDIRADFEVTQVEPTVDALKVTKKEKIDRNGRTVWKIEGTYGPDANVRSGGGLLKVHTDVKDPKNRRGKVKDVRVIAVVEGPLTVRPGSFLPLGRVKRAKGVTKVVEFEPNGDFDLQFKNVEITNLSVDKKWVTLGTSKEGKILKLELNIKPGAPRRLIRGDIKVELNHPAVKEKSLQFNGFVR